MVLDVNTQACAVAIVRFDRTPIMQETPKSEKQNEGTNTSTSNVNTSIFRMKQALKLPRIGISSMVTMNN